MTKTDSRERTQDLPTGRRTPNLRPVTFWLPDTQSPEFKAQAERESRAVAAAEEEDEINRFIEEVADWPPDEEKFWNDPDEVADQK